ncbi:hypothetical protein ACIRRA_14190 [Nocardia sp. NPDC101769]
MITGERIPAGIEALTTPGAVAVTRCAAWTLPAVSGDIRVVRIERWSG